MRSLCSTILNATKKKKKEVVRKKEKGCMEAGEEWIILQGQQGAFVALMILRYQGILFCFLLCGGSSVGLGKVFIFYFFPRPPIFFWCRVVTFGFAFFGNRTEVSVGGGAFMRSDVMGHQREKVEVTMARKIVHLPSSRVRRWRGAETG
ncbi:hypothetical protein TRVL_06372 [Trypanosoma vivax]|nr:hypothetical protein TRVL_06372 [Trypanosoma vivax]